VSERACGHKLAIANSDADILYSNVAGRPMGSPHLHCNFCLPNPCSEIKAHTLPD